MVTRVISGEDRMGDWPKSLWWIIWPSKWSWLGRLGKFGTVVRPLATINFDVRSVFASFAPSFPEIAHLSASFSIWCTSKPNWILSRKFLLAKICSSTYSSRYCVVYLALKVSKYVSSTRGGVMGLSENSAVPTVHCVQKCSNDLPDRLHCD